MVPHLPARPSCGRSFNTKVGANICISIYFQDAMSSSLHSFFFDSLSSDLEKGVCGGGKSRPQFLATCKIFSDWTGLGLSHGISRAIISA